MAIAEATFTNKTKAWAGSNPLGLHTRNTIGSPNWAIVYSAPTKSSPPTPILPDLPGRRASMVNPSCINKKGKGADSAVPLKVKKSRRMFWPLSQPPKSPVRLCCKARIVPRTLPTRFVTDASTSHFKELVISHTPFLELCREKEKDWQNAGLQMILNR